MMVISSLYYQSFIIPIYSIPWKIKNGREAALFPAVGNNAERKIVLGGKHKETFIRA